MAMVVNHNIPALSTYNVINSTSSALQKSINKLSTGLRINSAADDAAGLAISEKMRAQVRGLDQAVSNSQDGISMIQTAEGALSETHSILQRMRELSVQAANDTLTQQDRGYIQEEVDQLREEITRIGNTTQFNKKKLLNGDAAVLWSSDKNETKAIVNGGLRTIDQFGQKASAEGNYKISIRATAGQGEVQKTDLMKIKHEDVLFNKITNKVAGIDDVEGQSLVPGHYSVTGMVPADNAAAKVTGQFGIPETLSQSEYSWDYSTEPTMSSDTRKSTITINAKDSTGTLASKTITIPDGTGAPAWADVKKQILDAANELSVDGYTIKATDDTTGSKLVFKSFSLTKDEALEFEITTDNAGGTKITAPSLTADVKEDATDFTIADALAPTVESSKIKNNASILFEVTNVNTDSKVVEFRATSNLIDQNGNNSTVSYEFSLAEGNATPTELGAKLGLTDEADADGFTMKLAENFTAGFEKGAKFVLNVTASDGSDVGVKVTGTQDTSWDNSWGASVTDDEVQYGFKDAVAGKNLHLKNFYLNSNTGEATVGDIILKTNSDFKSANSDNIKDVVIADFDAAYIGKVAAGDVKLRDLDKFWDSQGNFMLTDPQTLTITQGDGKQASVTLYANDTLNDVANKLNSAIANDLGQGKYVDTAGGSKFVTFVEDGKDSTSESVEGTFLIRTVVPGANGTISLSGNEDILNAFSLNTIQNAKESSYTVDIKDAHTDKIIASDVRLTGNKLIGVINPNVDVEFDAMAGVTAKWDDSSKAFTYNTADYDTILHLSDNTTVFQIGANEGEDMGINIGDMRSHALGLDSVNVTNRESAARSITVIDNAIDKVSMQRSKLGAYQNRLEHTINNLTTASENLTAAESRIRDTDMAKEMMNFSKLQIMLQAGNSMLAQANQLPQNVLSLVR